MRNKRKNNSRKTAQQGAFQKNLGLITDKMIGNMSIIDSEKYIRFLRDQTTGLYVVFNGRINQSFYSSDYYLALRRFNYLVSVS